LHQNKIEETLKMSENSINNINPSINPKEITIGGLAKLSDVLDKAVEFYVTSKDLFDSADTVAFCSPFTGGIHVHRGLDLLVQAARYFIVGDKPIDPATYTAPVMRLRYTDGNLCETYPAEVAFTYKGVCFYQLYETVDGATSVEALGEEAK
jgi:hypothetical protein